MNHLFEKVIQFFSFLGSSNPGFTCTLIDDISVGEQEEEEHIYYIARKQKHIQACRNPEQGVKILMQLWTHESCGQVRVEGVIIG